MDKSIVIIGAGNVAHHLAAALRNSDYKILQIFSRSEASASLLAQQCGCDYTCNIGDVIGSAEIYLFCLTDDANQKCIAQFPQRGKTMIHTSGSMNPDIFAQHTSNYGVLYPLQSLKKEIATDISQVPFLVEASNAETLQLITDMSKAMGAQCSEANTEQRTWAHISAVFACNFSNHMLAIAFDIASRNNIPWAMLKPLIENTFKRSLHADPYTVQTGPAFRNEKTVMQKHIKMLNSRFNTYESLYKTISNSIFEMYKINKKEDE